MCPTHELKLSQKAAIKPFPWDGWMDGESLVSLPKAVATDPCLAAFQMRLGMTSSGYPSFDYRTRWNGNCHAATVLAGLIHCVGTTGPRWLFSGCRCQSSMLQGEDGMCWWSTSYPSGFWVDKIAMLAGLAKCEEENSNPCSLS